MRSNLVLLQTAVCRSAANQSVRLLAAIYRKRLQQNAGGETLPIISIPTMTDMVAFADVRKKLWNEIVSLYSVWSEYKYLFETSEDRIVLLNACAGRFFGTVQWVMLREVILGISRLTDPIKTGKFDNMVISQLLSDPVIDNHFGLRADLTKAVDDAVAAAEVVRTHRNKYVAHLDHATALDPSLSLLPGLTFARISEAVESIAAAYNVHSHGLREPHAVFDPLQEANASMVVAILEMSSAWKDWQEMQVRVAKRSASASV